MTAPIERDAAAEVRIEPASRESAPAPVMLTMEPAVSVPAEVEAFGCTIHRDADVCTHADSAQS